MDICGLRGCGSSCVRECGCVCAGRTSACGVCDVRACVVTRVDGTCVCARVRVSARVRVTPAWPR